MLKHVNIPASYLTLFQDNKILLLRRTNTGYEDGNYSMIAGHVEAGETFTDCIIREAKEEAGIIITEKDLKVAHVLHRNSEKNEKYERVDIFFVAKKWDGEIINKEPHKCDDLSWFDLDNIPINTIPYIKHIIQEIKKWNNYSEFGWE